MKYSDRQNKENKPVLRSLYPQSNWLWIIITSLLVGIVGLLDYLTGPEIAFSILYLIPVMLGVWFIGKNFGLAISILSSAVWMIAELTSGRFYSHIAIHYWNTATMLSFFLIVTFLLERLKTALNTERLLARIDYLTGVMNPRSFYEAVTKELERCKRYKRHFTVAYLDIDDFKSINDQFGHPIGDIALRTVAGVIKKNIRSVDVVARLGGDEFAILFPETAEKAATKAIQKVKNAIKNEDNLKEWSITLSIGILTCKTCPPNAEQMMVLVDSLMYSVKRHGKNGIKHSTYKIKRALITSNQSLQ
jgi:diguanylate cyclase (GGDEF)-like protein